MADGTWVERMAAVEGEPLGWEDADYFCWGGQAVRGPGEEGEETVHFFGARWPKWSGFLGWLLRSEIVRLTAMSVTGPFRFREVVLGPRGEKRADGTPFWDQDNLHNPTVIRVGKKYCLFYNGSQHDPEKTMGEREVPAFTGYTSGDYGYVRMRQRVGVAVADSPLGPWHRMDAPLVEPTEKWAPWFTTNPSACVGPDGRIYLYYKSIDPVHHRMKLGVAIAEKLEGPYVKHPGNPVVDPGAEHHVEDHFVWVQEGRFHMLLKDLTGRLTGRPNATAELESIDGLAWDLGQARLAYEPGWPRVGGGWHATHRMEQTNLLIAGGKPVCLYAAVLTLPERYCPHYPGFAAMAAEEQEKAQRQRAFNVAIGLRG